MMSYKLECVETIGAGVVSRPAIGIAGSGARPQPGDADERLRLRG